MEGKEGKGGRCVVVLDSQCWLGTPTAGEEQLFQASEHGEERKGQVLGSSSRQDGGLYNIVGSGGKFFIS